MPGSDSDDSDPSRGAANPIQVILGGWRPPCCIEVCTVKEGVYLQICTAERAMPKVKDMSDRLLKGTISIGSEGSE